MKYSMKTFLENDYQHNRQTTRQTILAARESLTPAERTSKSCAVTAKVVSLPTVVLANVVFSYLHFRSEVETTGLIDRLYSTGKEVCVPVTVVDQSKLLAVRLNDIEQQTGPGYCGIPEPHPSIIETNTLDPSTIDVVIVPGSVFDNAGGRLGYGGGYYDRFLHDKAPSAVRIGLAFDLQLVETVPVQPHDQYMDYIVTETTIYDCRSNRYA